MRLLKTWAGLLTAAVLILATTPHVAHSQLREQIDTREETSAWVYKGDLISLKVYSLTRIAITKPGVVQVANADPEEILLVGQNPGETTLFVWDEYGKRKILVLVIQEDLDIIIARMLKLLENAGIDTLTLEKDMIEGKVVVTGRYPKHKADDAEDILGRFKANIVNLAKEDQGALIQVDTQVTELTTTLSEAIGFHWNTGATGMTFTYRESLPSFDGSPGDFFKIGDFERTTSMLVVVENLISEGKARVLSNPKIVVTNGEAASFLVGGEIPIRRTTTSTGGNVTEDISFKSYGIDVNITPTIVNDKIDVTLNVSIRDIDSSNAVGSDVAFTTRSAKTKLYLEDGQTIILAGLIKHNAGEAYNRVPWLSDIPVIGAFFRHKETSQATTDTEVVISLTPRILRDADEKEKALAEQEMGDESGMQEDGVAEMVDISPQEEEQDAMQEDPSLAGSSTGDKLAMIKGKSGPDASPEGMMIESGGDLEKSIDDLLMQRKETEDMVDDSLGIEQKQVSGVLTQYVQSIQQKIARAISFPYRAKEKGWEGTVKLTLIILSDGSLNEVYVMESSGHEVFDSDAVNTAQILSPYEPFPSEIELEEVTVTIPIVYSQEEVLGGYFEGAQIQKDAAPEKPKDALVKQPPIDQETYEQIVSQKISGQAIYPKVAKDNGWEGEVKMNLRILRNGILADVSLEKSSGYELIDICSLKLAKEASPYDQFPSSWQDDEIHVTVPLVYKLNN